MVTRSRVTGIALLLVMLAACGQEIRTDNSAVPAEVTRLPGLDAAGADNGVGDDDAGQALELTTVLYSEHDAEVTARRAGVISTINVELGDALHAGQELARLDDGTEQAAFDAASAARVLAKSEHERVAKLAEQEMVTTAELDAATYRLRTAEAALADASVRLDYTRIRAPFDGAVTRRFIRTGQTVAEGDPLFRTTALSPLRALVRVPEENAAALRTGMPVTLRGLAGRQAAGRILRISPAVDPASGTVEVLVDVAAPGGLRPGSTVQVEFGRRPPAAQ